VAAGAFSALIEDEREGASGAGAGGSDVRGEEEVGSVWVIGGGEGGEAAEGAERGAWVPAVVVELERGGGGEVVLGEEVAEGEGGMAVGSLGGRFFGVAQLTVEGIEVVLAVVPGAGAEFVLEGVMRF